MARECRRQGVSGVHIGAGKGKINPGAAHFRFVALALTALALVVGAEQGGERHRQGVGMGRVLEGTSPLEAALPFPSL